MSSVHDSAPAVSANITSTTNAIDRSVSNFISLWNARSHFFSDAFIRKLLVGNKKALLELQQSSIQPTPMDLRDALQMCVKAGVPDDENFMMNDGHIFTMRGLKERVPGWATIALNALMASDPALADKLMSPAQWNAKSAFEVIYTTAVNELKNIKKTKQVAGPLSHYTKWILTPLADAIKQVKNVNPPGNALIGYGDRVALAAALRIAEGLESEFKKVMKL